MSLLQPVFLFFLLTIPVLIFLYMVRPKHKKVVIPSTFLWEQLKRRHKTAKPLQKLRVSLLLILGIFALLSFSMYLASPAIFVKYTFDNVIFVFDNSASMAVRLNNSETYLQASKKIAKDILSNLPGRIKVSIVTFSDTVEILQKFVPPSVAKDTIDSVVQKYYPADVKESIKLIAKLFGNSSSKLFIFTDKNIISLKNIKLYKFQKAENNVSIENILCVRSSDGFDALVELKNRGVKKANFDLELFADGKLVGFKSISLLPNRSENFLFEKIKGNYKIVWGRINYSDQLTEDNVFWTVLEPVKTKQKVLYVGKGNFFLEKVWLAFDDVEFYKTADVDSIAENFDIYIFDQCLPKKFPQKCAFIILLPQDSNKTGLLSLKIGKSKDNEGYARFINSDISKNIDGMDFAVQKAIFIDDMAFKPVAKLGNRSVISFGNIQNHPSVLFGFAIDNSDLPLKVSFPVLMANIKNVLIKNNQLLEKTVFYPGEDIKVYSYSSQKINITLPNGRRQTVILSSFPYILPKKDILGIYTLTLDEDKRTEYKFALNFPVFVLDETGENDFAINKSNSKEKVDSVKTPYSLKDIFLILGVVFLTLEWMVFLNENRV